MNVLLNQNFLFKDTAAYTSFYNKHINELYSYGISLGFSENICMDAIHDVFCKIYVNENELRNIRNIKHYLFKSLKNRLLDIYRKNKKITFDEIDDYSFTFEVSVMDSIIDEEERDSLKHKVEELMNTLTNNQREAIYLRYMQEMEYEEIAQILNINAESVRKLVYRGIDRLREQSNLGIIIILFVYFLYYNYFS
jgi:RNA polymerase sigma factor (sigma-70 family)